MKQQKPPLREKFFEETGVEYEIDYLAVSMRISLMTIKVRTKEWTVTR